MLRSMELDGESYQDILNEAVSQIVENYEGWTNYNSSDPGITLVELFAWLTEVQRYHLNYIGEENLMRFLRLLGSAPAQPTPSRAWLVLSGSGFLPSKTLYYAEHIPFETLHDIDVVENRLLYAEGGGERILNTDDAFSKPSARLCFSPFADSSREFTLAFEKPFERGRIISLYFEIASQINTEGLSDSFVPYIKYHMELTNGVLSRRVEIIRDTTYSLSKSGIVAFKVPSGLYAGRRTLLKLVADEGDCEYPPQISAILLNAVEASQQMTLAYSVIYGSGERRNTAPPTGFKAEIFGIKGERLVTPDTAAADKLMAVYYRSDFYERRYIGRLRGESNAVLKTDVENILPRSLGIIIKESDGFYRWERVDSFDSSDKFSRHFVCKGGELIFGDGDRGMPPKGEVYFTDTVISEGGKGNVKELAVDYIDPASGTHGVNIAPSQGGKAPLSIDECFAAAVRDMSTPECCVTPEDFEAAVRKTPGVYVSRVKAFVRENTENTVYIAVETQKGRAANSPTALINLENNIKDKRMVGTRVVFLQPGYARLSLVISLSAEPSPNVRGKIEQALRDYFDSPAVNFGSRIRISRLSSLLAALPFVKSVNGIELDLMGSGGRRLAGGDIKLLENHLPYLEKMDIDFSGVR